MQRSRLGTHQTADQ